MKIIKARKLTHCKKCMGDIWPTDYYYPQRRKKAICLGCGKDKKQTLMSKFLCWLGGHGE